MTTHPAAPLPAVQPDTSEWTAMWYGIEADRVNADIPEPDRRTAVNPSSGEQWQYMGTWMIADHGCVHQFRHRNHPLTGRREYRDVWATCRYHADNRVQIEAAVQVVNALTESRAASLGA